MRNRLLGVSLLAAGFAVTGCVYSHHPAVYTAATTDAALGTTRTEVVTAPTTVVATSPRPAVRVYSMPETPKLSVTTPVPPPVHETTVVPGSGATVVPGRIVASSNSADTAIVASIRQMLENDAARLYRNVDFEVDNGMVIMRGTVPTDHDRIELQNRLVTMPGVLRVDNKLDVELH